MIHTPWYRGWRVIYVMYYKKYNCSGGNHSDKTKYNTDSEVSQCSQSKHHLATV